MSTAQPGHGSMGHNNVAPGPARHDQARRHGAVTAGAQPHNKKKVLTNMSLLPIVEGPARRGAYLPGIFISAIAAVSFLPRIALHDTLWAVHLGIAALLAVWYLAVWMRDRGLADGLSFRIRLVAPHYVQACLHLSIYIFWGYYWELVAHNGLLIVAQVLFAFAFEGLLNWTRGKAWRLGFGPLPIIFSTNLFLTFKDDWFVWQFVLIAIGFLAKEFIVWKRDGVRTHIFNPSAFTLFLFAVVLISTGQTDKTWVSQLSATLDTRLVDPASHPYLFLFAVGLVAQFLFQVTLVTLASALMLFALPSLYGAMSGTYWFVDTGIPAAVFLGLHLLITDPATSPRSAWGRFLFGVFYGSSVFAIYGVLDHFGEPLAYDKLLFVPILNLLVIPIDRAGAFLHSQFAKLKLRVLPVNATVTQWNLFHMALWVGLFAWMYVGEYIESDHPGRQLHHWQASCARGAPNACQNLAETLTSRCMQGAHGRCAELSNLYATKPGLATPIEQQIWFGRACDAGALSECERYEANLTTNMRTQLIADCDAGGSAMSCYVVGSGHLKGIGHTPRSPEEAYGFMRKGCEQGLGQSCGVMGMMHQFGIVEADLALAVAFHKTACGRSFTPSCTALAELYANPSLSVADAALGNWYRAKACAIGARALCDSRTAEGSG